MRHDGAIHLYRTTIRDLKTGEEAIVIVSAWSAEEVRADPEWLEHLYGRGEKFRELEVVGTPEELSGSGTVLVPTEAGHEVGKREAR